jgi:uncharacterized glyoxalase superfamily protein PhnB
MTENSQIDQVFVYLRTRDGNAAIEFYKQAFGAVENLRLSEPSGRVAHAELKLGPSTLMLSDEYPEHGIHAPQENAPTGCGVHLHVDNVDTLVKQAVEAGATVTMEAQDQFYGERSARLRDPFGHEWLIGQQIEELSHEEIQRRFDAMFETD